MNDNSENGIPKLNHGIPAINADPQLSQVFKDLGNYHGHAVTIQDETGSKIPFRVNKTTAKFEIFNNGKWTEVSL